MKIILLISFIVSFASACPNNQACKKLNINIDLKSSMEIGEVVAVELCRRAQNCEPTDVNSNIDNEYVNGLLANFANFNVRMSADGIGLVQALNIHNELNQNLRQLCDPNSCIHCGN